MVIFHSDVSLPEDICFGTCIWIIVPAQGLLLLILFPNSWSILFGKNAPSLRVSFGWGDPVGSERLRLTIRLVFRSSGIKKLIIPLEIMGPLYSLGNSNP